MTQTVNGGGPVRPVTEQSTGELVQHASEQLTRLVREELALARAELADKGRRAGRGAGMLGFGGLLALYGLGALVLAAILGLAVVTPGWLAALIVGVAVLLVAGFVALVGREQLRAATTAAGSSAESLRADLDTVTTAVRERRRTAGRPRPEVTAESTGPQTQQPTTREEARL